MTLNPDIIFTPSPVPVTEEQILAFEKQIGFTFPDDYRMFVKQFNGPKMKSSDPTQLRSEFYLTMDLRAYASLGETKACDVSHWIGFADPTADYQYGIKEIYEVTSGDWNLPNSIVAIATSVGPAKIYLSLAQDSYGHVLLIGDQVIERQSDELEIRTSDFVTYATSFTEFVAKLRWTNSDDEL